MKMKNIPISGFFYESAEDHTGSEHSHVLYLTHWDGRPVHVHEFGGVTSFDAGHRHGYEGTTEPAPSGVPHTHRYHTITSFDDGHRHEIRGVTGPAISVAGGGHIHRFEGVTSVDGDPLHEHSYSGRTSDD
jgi:hypothetical protein